MTDTRRRYKRDSDQRIAPIGMAASQACTGLRQASTFGARQPAALHDIPTCASPVLFARRSLHVRHLGAKPSLGSCRGLSSKRNDVRPAVPRQGRLQCHAARSQVTGMIQCQPLGNAACSKSITSICVCRRRTRSGSPRRWMGCKKH